MSRTPRYYLTGWQSFFFVLLRIAIGWHFLREGWVKLCDPTWTAVGYLVNSWGPLSPYFRMIGETPWMLNLANFTMPWMLFLSGLGLMLGLFTRSSTLLAMVLLAMFYSAAPPIEAMPPYERWGTNFQWVPFKISLDHAQWAGQHMLNTEGNYMIVNKNLIEFLALAALLTINSGMICGLDVYIRQWFAKEEPEEQPAEAPLVEA